MSRKKLAVLWSGFNKTKEWLIKNTIMGKRFTQVAPIYRGGKGVYCLSKHNI